MGKEKVVEEVIKNITNAESDMTTTIFKYAPLIIGLIALVACYLLYKKFQSVNNTSDSLGKLEKQFTGFIKEQSEINIVNSKKFNSILAQMNQLSYILQNSNAREQNDLNSQMSPEKTMLPPLEKQVSQQPPQQLQQQPQQRELIPNSIQTNYPMKPEQLPDEMLKPVVTSNKKETFNEQIQQQIQQIPTQVMEESNNKQFKNKNSKKVVTLTEDVLIEEASSDDE